MPDLRRGRHVIFKLVVHLVFVTKYRREALSDQALCIIEESCRKVCRDFESDMLEFNGENDHVHLLISYPPKVAISRLVNSLKGVSSRHVRVAQLPEVTAMLWGKHFWSPSYFAGSAGGVTIETLKQYVQDQDRPDCDSPPS